MRLLTINIENPSAARAARQLAWIADRDDDVFVLTETKASEGCDLLAAAFTNAGYHVVAPLPPAGGYGTMIASRLPMTPDPWTATVPYLPERVASALLEHPEGRVRIVGVYVPARDATPEKTERKRAFLNGLMDALDEATGLPLVLLGDLNVLEPDHRPHYGFFRPFEYDFYRGLGKLGLSDAVRLCHPDTDVYSWVGRTGDGYRYDHAFISHVLAPAVRSCEYLHSTRMGEPRLTDHSALVLELDVPGPLRLHTSDLFASTEATLF